MEGGEGFGFLWTLPPGSATVSRHVRYTLNAQYAGINKQKNPQFSNTLLDIYQQSIALMKRKFYSLLFKFVAAYEVSKKNVTNSIDLRNMQDNYIL